MAQLASRPEDEVRHALEVLFEADPAVVTQQLRCIRVPSVGFLASVRADAAYRDALGSLEHAIANLPTVVDPATTRAVQATENLWRRADHEFGLLTSSQVGEILGASRNNRTYASALRKRGELLGMQRKNAYVFPGFQFDRAAGAVLPWVKDLLVLAAEHGRSESDVIAWMLSPTTYLAGDRPADRVNESELLLSVATRAWGTDW